MLNKQTLISIEDALPGREQPMQIEDCHFVNQSSLTAPLAHHQQQQGLTILQKPTINSILQRIRMATVA